MMDKVIFRKWPNGDVIALFPQIAASVDGYLCQSYMTIGQHDGATPFLMYKGTKPAKPEEYEELMAELKQLGYDPVVGHRFTQRDCEMRKSQYEG